MSEQVAVKVIGALPCIRCGANLASEGSAGDKHPKRALVFRSVGDQESELFDSRLGQLQINLCGDCIPILEFRQKIALLQPGSNQLTVWNLPAKNKK